MTKAEAANEPSMEDILASIRKIIAEEPLTFPPASKRADTQNDFDTSSREAFGNDASPALTVAAADIGQFGQNGSALAAAGDTSSPLDDLADLIDDARFLNTSASEAPAAQTAAELPVQPTHGFFASRAQRTVKREGFISAQPRIEPSLALSDTESSQSPAWTQTPAGPSLSFQQAVLDDASGSGSVSGQISGMSGGAGMGMGMGLSGGGTDPGPADAVNAAESLRNFPRDFGTIVPNRTGALPPRSLAGPSHFSSLAETDDRAAATGFGTLAFGVAGGMSDGALDGGRLIADAVTPSPAAAALETVANEPLAHSSRRPGVHQEGDLPVSLMDEIKRNAEASAPLKASLKAEVERAADILKQTNAASASAAARGEATPAGSGTTLEDIVAVLMKPLLKSWIDENMPRMIENALRNEIAATLGQAGTQNTSANDGIKRD